MIKIVTDLHLHSKYSRAVSQQMEPKTMALWADKKGIDLIATADWTHPFWLKELESQLKETASGVFQLKDKSAKAKFVLSTEISSIYSQDGQTRRIHNLVLVPSFKTAHKINDQLKNKGCNLASDGRPIIGLSSIELAELVWSKDQDSLIIPAHVWTPWFALYGSKSGFDSLKRCFGQYSDNIYAIETGLSSDPAMNWRIKDLENKSIVSFSDSHSPPKLGRELTIFSLKNKNQTKKTEFSFNDLTEALKQSKDANWQIAYTVEFYPEEGKYHYTGHRNCKVRFSPAETRTKGTTCPVCGRSLTLGVMHRVEQLANEPEIKPIKKQNQFGLTGYYHPTNEKRPPYVMLVPLMEIIAESFSMGVSSQKVTNEYNNLTKNLGSEYDILTQTKTKDIKQISNEKIAEGIEKVRKGEIVVEPGFDGVFGIVKIWKKDENKKEELLQNHLSQEEQMSLF